MRRCVRPPSPVDLPLHFELEPETVNAWGGPPLQGRRATLLSRIVGTRVGEACRKLARQGEGAVGGLPPGSLYGTLR